MPGAPTGFWGKLKKDDAGIIVGWHSVDDHAADVAACCEALLMHTLLRQRLARLAGQGNLTPVQIGRLSYLAALHDIGKFGIGFQNKALDKPPFTCGHVSEVMALFGGDGYPETDRLIGALPLEVMCAWGADEDATVRLLAAAICHHGRPYQAGGSRDARNWQRDLDRDLDPFAGIRGLAEKALDWFPTDSNEPADRLPGDSAFQHAVSGLMMLGDWLGSDEAFFPYSVRDGTDRLGFARQRATEVLHRIGLDATSVRRSLGKTPPVFSSIFGPDHGPFEPRPMQARCLALAEPLSDHQASLAVLEAETGSGKTEAALALYLRMFQKELVDGLYFALPTRTAATQIHRRVVEAMARAFPEPDTRPAVVLAVPGYLRVDEEEGKREAAGKRLARFEVLWNDDDRERFRYRGWAAENAKRYLAGSVVVGTIDQVLLSSLMVNHAHLRATALLRLLLVVDEVHASDAYMTRILEHVLRRHFAAGGHALLMSATLGAAARHRLLGALAPDSRPPTSQDARKQPFPAISRVAGGDSAQLEGVESAANPKAIAVRLEPVIDAPERIARRALDAAVAGAKVLVIRNTVAGCIATQESIEALAASEGSDGVLFGINGVAAPHHARFAKEDRTLLDEALEHVYGKDDSKRPAAGCVVVATQTIQQSLDLDADLMLTDLCPMDVLLQRVGRLHRHHRSGRPAGFEKPCVVVLLPNERDLSARIRRGGAAWGGHGIGSVYDDLRILEATWRCLAANTTLEIPTMNRELVERSTHPEELATIVAELGGAWHAHEQHVGGSGSADKRVAELNMIDTRKHFGEFQFPSRELARVVQTRLGEGDRLAEFGTDITSPFGKSIRQLTIPYHMARDVPPEAVPQAVAGGAGWLRFSLGPRRYLYDRLGLRLLAEDPRPPREEDRMEEEDGMEDV